MTLNLSLLTAEHKANAETEKGAALLLASTHGELPVCYSLFVFRWLFQFVVVFLQLVQFVVQSLIARRYDEGKQKIAHALEVSPSNAAAAAAAADTPAKGKKESKRRGSGKDEKQTQMETETEPEAETEPASAKSSVGVLVPEFAREVGLSVSDVAAAAALEGKEEKTEQRAQPLLRKLLKRQQRKAAKQRGAVDAEGLDTDSEDEDEDDNENKEKNETESGLSTELLRDCVKAAAERSVCFGCCVFADVDYGVVGFCAVLFVACVGSSDADVVEYLLTVGACLIAHYLCDFLVEF